MKEAHRSEVESLLSKTASLTGQIDDLQKKQHKLLDDHQKELELAESNKNEEVAKLWERLSSSEVRM